MNRGLYGKLAVNNIKHNRQFYLPYLLTGMLTVAFFYTMLYLNHNPGLDELPFGAMDVELVLGLGAVIIGFFSVIFLFYTNSFIMKRRKKELGIYNILGMEKRHLTKVIFLETFFSAVVAIGGGLVAGIAFSKLMCMLLYAMIGYHASYFYVAKEFVRDNIDIEILEELLSLGGLGIQYCIKSELAYSKLEEIDAELMSVNYNEFNDKYNQRDVVARKNMRELVNSDVNKVTNVFSTLFER